MAGPFKRFAPKSGYTAKPGSDKAPRDTTRPVVAKSRDQYRKSGRGR